MLVRLFLLPLVLTLLFRIRRTGHRVCTNWYNESHKAKRQKELEDAKEEGRRQGRAEAEAALEAAQQELYDESAPDTGIEPSSDE